MTHFWYGYRLRCYNSKSIETFYLDTLDLMQPVLDSKLSQGGLDWISATSSANFQG